jgi:hypothetical protein
VVDKLIPLKVEDQVYVELREQVVIPIEVPIPTTIIEQRIVPVEHVIPIVQTVDRIIEKPFEVRVEMPGRVEERDRIV